MFCAVRGIEELSGRFLGGMSELGKKARARARCGKWMHDVLLFLQLRAEPALGGERGGGGVQARCALVN